MKKMKKMIGSMSMKTILISVLLCSNVTNLFPANCMSTYCIFIIYCECILYRNSKPTEKEIAITLILLKARHKLSNTCIRDMCHLLRILKVHNAPKNYSRITRIFTEKLTQATKHPLLIFVSNATKSVQIILLAIRPNVVNIPILKSLLANSYACQSCLNSEIFWLVHDI